MSFRKKLAEALEHALRQAQQKGQIAAADVPEITIERPAKPEHGDYASSLPLKLAKVIGMRPMEVAAAILENMPTPQNIEKIDVAPPGFINFTVDGKWLVEQVELACKAGEAYGDSPLDRKSVQIEFVSVNPTGPLHVGHGRGAVLGSTLANVLRSAGYRVSTEYYINDAGSQLDAFYHSLFARYRECLGEVAELPENGYHGNYMIDFAREIAGVHQDKFLKMPPDEAVKEIGAVGLQMVMQKLKDDLEMLGVKFDVWFSELSLFQNGQFDKTMTMLREASLVTERENAVWFASSTLGDDKDNVLIRSDGTPTYFASDIAYHYNKFVERKFDSVIDIWGADHQGHVPRMKVVVNALGIDPDRLTIIITQLVTLRRGKEIVRVSKRSGDLITLREVMDEVGADACRFVFLSRSADSQMDFDLELAIKQSADNPVYYVQYAHARICSILKNAREKNIDFSNGDTALLKLEPELTLIRHMVKISEIIDTVAISLEPHHLPFYAQELATVFHSFYKQCRVISDDDALTRSRLKLVKAAQIVLAKVLHLMGMTAPESM
ncbi:MAG: arginine--tRNA ligase [Dehalococcoidia bacterium]|nr:arginine--tRNA ligase [Dehalococcoidia bacterium]MDD5494687.1 arginine--tRNA ligase [Dehalococcoidia bacterium]